MRIKSLALKYRRLTIVATHFGLIIGGYIFAFYLRLDFKIDREYWQIIIKTIPLLIFIKLVLFWYYGLFSGLWRYVSVGDIWKIIKASFFASVAFIIGVIFIHTTSGYPRSIFLLDWIVCTGLIGGVRFATRLLRERFKPAITIKLNKALIVGAGETDPISPSA